MSVAEIAGADAASLLWYLAEEGSRLSGYRCVRGGEIACITCGPPYALDDTVRCRIMAQGLQGCDVQRTSCKLWLRVLCAVCVRHRTVRLH